MQKNDVRPHIKQKIVRRLYTAPAPTGSIKGIHKFQPNHQMGP